MCPTSSSSASLPVQDQTLQSANNLSGNQARSLLTRSIETTTTTPDQYELFTTAAVATLIHLGLAKNLWLVQCSNHYLEIQSRPAPLRDDFPTILKLWKWSLRFPNPVGTKALLVGGGVSVLWKYVIHLYVWKYAMWYIFSWSLFSQFCAVRGKNFFFF